MQFGFITGGSMEQIRKDIAIAERSCIDLLGLADSQFLINELYTNLGAIAGETETIEIGPTMTNPVTRHPTVHASAICNLQELSDGRAFLGLASGDSAVHTLGKQPARLGELKKSATVIKQLSRGESVTYGDRTLKLEWLSPERTYEFPLAVAAEGPKTLEVAGQVADRVVIGLGKTTEIVRHAIDKIETGANAINRNPSEIEIWLYADANIRSRSADAVDDITHSLAASAHHSLQFSFEDKCVPPDREDALQTLVDDYDSTVHGQPDEQHNGQLVERLGLREYLAERYAIAGTPEDCQRDVKRLDELGSVDGILFAVHTEDRTEVMDKFATDVLPEI